MTDVTKPNYRTAAEGQLFFAKMARLYGDTKAAEAHRELASVYIKGELEKSTTPSEGS